MQKISSSSPRSASPENGFLLNTPSCTIDDNNAHQKFQLEYPDIYTYDDDDFLESVVSHSEMYLPPMTPMVSKEEYDEIPIDCFENGSNSGSFTSRIRQMNAIFLQRLQDIANNKNDNKDVSSRKRLKQKERNK